MRAMGRVMAILFLLFSLVLGTAATFVVRYQPRQRPAGTESVARTPDRIARGRYLAEGALGCMDCHAKHDLAHYGNPVTGPMGAGGDCFGARERFPGTLCMSNLTPDPETGLGAWSDGEIKRAIREGVGRDGHALFPIMPYSEYSALSDNDADAVVAYLRALPAVHNPVPAANIDFPVKYFIKLAPTPLPGPVPDPSATDRVAQGKYLARVSGCIACHSPVDQRHQPLRGQELSGGQEFTGVFGVLRSSNLTPHATGLGDRDQAAFVGLFKSFAVPAADLPLVEPKDGTIMPWLSRARMSEADLGAIYAYLRAVPPIDHVVEKRARPALPHPGGDSLGR
jgi:mono/diheme cytochrome c family protein